MYPFCHFAIDLHLKMYKVLQSISLEATSAALTYQFYSQLYAKGFYRGLCLYISHILIYRKCCSHAPVFLWLLTVFSDVWSDKKKFPL